jgi:hypothetical protein
MHWEMIGALLEVRQDPAVQNDAFLTAASNGQVDVVTELPKSGADPTARYEALRRAAAGGNVDVIRYLLKQSVIRLPPKYRS